MKHITHEVDFCVVGGGLAGLCAAVAAARRGAKTLLMHDRPVLGGNASSEIRMWICGATGNGPHMRETGLVEEIQLDNLQRNPHRSYALWDALLYEKAAFQENLALLLNCSCCEAKMDGARIREIRGWQSTAETWHTVRAPLFADCSGDSILAPLSGAEFRIGREASSEFGESIAPEEADSRTMGMSCLLQVREMNTPQSFTPPAWANHYDEAFFARKFGSPIGPYTGGTENFWWIEVGGLGDTVHDAEKNRDELLKIVYGVWDFYKNGPHARATANWALDWVGVLPGKRESRRYVGDHVMTQNDVRAGGSFDDIVAYGGWTMDDHFPAGFHHQGGSPTIHHPVPRAYGIPYRCLYSRNIENLMFAGRNTSVTHTALSSSRVMSTCAILGQAAGTAAAIAMRHGLSPRGVYEHRLGELQAHLLDDDCHLLDMPRAIGPLARAATLSASCGEPAIVINGIDRPRNGDLNAWQAGEGDWLEFRFAQPQAVGGMRLVFDSNLDFRILNMPSNYPLNAKFPDVPDTLVRGFRIETQRPDGTWETAAEVQDNAQRLVRLRFSPRNTAAVRLVVASTRREAPVNVFAAEPLAD
ncbi:MAG: FAD-dependent oxidoreductase [Kiritimatiellae bacterium]|nr:FAD-dependent oxidoreductase [Kiritimatiellia bacterium]